MVHTYAFLRLAALTALLLAALAAFAAPVEPGNASWTLTLQNVAAGQPATLTLTSHFGLFATGAAPDAPKTAVKAAGLVIEGMKVRGTLAVTVDKVATLYTVDATVRGTAVAGMWTAGEGDAAARGTLAGTLDALPPDTARLQLLEASFLGTAEDDDIQGGAVGPDGSIYLVGNTGASMTAAPGGVKVTTLGADAAAPRCGYGFVMRLSPDGSRVLGYTQLAHGMAMLTAAAVTPNGVYVSGYATDTLEPLLQGRKGLITTYPLREDVRILQEGRVAEMSGDPAGEASIAKNPGLGRYGAPCVLRFSADLRTLESGTYLEGWQQTWGKFRVFVKPFKEGFQEYCWQPVSLGVLPDGDIVVSHDGGYFRWLTAKDRELAAKIPDEAQRAELLKKLCFYDVPDYVSRLSPALDRRAWKASIYTPAIAEENMKAVKPYWPLPHYSNPRTLRMRVDRQGGIFIAGWSASATSSEPWWTPYLWKLSPDTGEVAWKAYAWDPMSGGGHRMGGQVADTAVATVAVEEDGNLLTALHSDGGNNAMGGGPRGHEGIKPIIPITGGGYAGGLVHFNGQVQRVDAVTRDGLGGSRNGHSAWVTDIAPLKGLFSIGLGRWNVMGGWSQDAWFTGDSGGPKENPNAFLRLYAPDFSELYTTAVPNIWPFEAVPIGPTRALVTGRADKPLAAIKDPLQAASAGKSDGYFMIIEVKP